LKFIYIVAEKIIAGQST